MKVNLKLSDRVTVQGEGSTMVEVFEQLSRLEEVWSETCNKCKCTQTKHVTRTVEKGKKTYTYHELHCRGCSAKLALGTSNDDLFNIYPKRYLMDGNEYVLDEKGNKIVKGNWGWTLYNKKTGKEE